MINKILQKYSGHRNYWYPDVKEPNLYVNSDLKEKYSKDCEVKELKLLEKWKNKIPKGWYGFSLGSPCPHIWYKIIDEFLEYMAHLEEAGMINYFQIHQIKIKFGGLRFYIQYEARDEEMNEFISLQIEKLTASLYDEKLIY